MEDSNQRRHLIGFTILTAVSILIFQISVVFFLFTIPLFIIQQKYGMQFAFYAGFFVAFVIILQTVIRDSGIEGNSLRQFLVVVELSYPLAIIGGLMSILYFRINILYLFVFSTLGFAIISLPVIIHYSGNEEIMTILKDQIVYVSEILREGAGVSDTVEGSLLLSQLQPGRIIESMVTLVFRNYLFAYFIMLAGSWYLAGVIYRRWHKMVFLKLIDFKVPEIMIWPLLISMVGVVFDILIGLNWIGYIMWNGTFIMALIYGLNGLGLIGYLLNKYKVPRRSRRMIAIISVAVLLIPGINLVILIGIPVLGISEIWVRYKV